MPSSISHSMPGFAWRDIGPYALCQKRVRSHETSAGSALFVPEWRKTIVTTTCSEWSSPKANGLRLQMSHAQRVLYCANSFYVYPHRLGRLGWSIVSRWQLRSPLPAASHAGELPAIDGLQCGISGAASISESSENPRILSPPTGL